MSEFERLCLRACKVSRLGAERTSRTQRSLVQYTICSKVKNGNCLINDRMMHSVAAENSNAAPPLGLAAGRHGIVHATFTQGLVCEPPVS
ncbi:hypothetical protein [Leucobacter sp. BZR 635]